MDASNATVLSNIPSIKRPIVHIARTTDLASDIRTALEAVRWRDKVSSDSVVFIKPNFTFPIYRPGITTNPEVLRVLLSLLKDRADRVIVGESDGGNNAFTADHSLAGHNMAEICRETGAEMVNLSRLPRTDVEAMMEGTRVRVQLPRLLLEDVDCFMSVPVLKVHANTGVTLSIKNLWGCYPDTMRCRHHSHLSYKLALIVRSVQPKLILVDGTYALDGHGPMYGTPKKTDLLMAGDNPVTTDAAGAALMSIPLRKVDHIAVAERMGLGTAELNEADLTPGWEKLRMKFTVQRTFLDHCSMLLFRSDRLAWLVMDSPISSLTYGVVRTLRNEEEKAVARDVRR